MMMTKTGTASPAPRRRRSPGRRAPLETCFGALALLVLVAGPAGAQGASPAWEAVVPDGMRAGYERNHYAPAVRIGDLLILSGVIGWSGTGDNGPEAQFVRAFERLKGVLAGAGLSLEDVAEITTYHVDLGELGRPFIEVKERYFELPPWPAWTAIGVDRLFLDGALVEIRAIAVYPDGADGGEE